MKLPLTDTDVDISDVRWSPEAIRVHEWRYEWLVHAGYTPGAAAVISQRPDIDWHEASDLIKHCPEQVALNILL